MGKPKKEERVLRIEDCIFPGFKNSTNYYDFITINRNEPDLLIAAKALISKSGEELRLSRLKFVFLRADDPDVKKEALKEILEIPGVQPYSREISLLTDHQPSGMD